MEDEGPVDAMVQDRPDVMMDEEADTVWGIDSNPGDAIMSNAGSDDGNYEDGDGDDRDHDGDNGDHDDGDHDDEDHDDDGHSKTDDTNNDGSPLPDGDALKVGWSEDTVQTEAMAQLGLCVNTAARVVVCIACASAIRPCELTGHLAKTHPPMSTTASYSEELAATYNLRPEVDSRPGSIITAVYGLDLVAGYITCDTCGYAAMSGKAMAKHIRESEGCMTFQPRPVQTFRPSSGRMYFGVNVEPAPADDLEGPSLDPLTHLTEKYAPVAFRHLPIKSAKTPRDANHFLNIEKWDLYVEGKTGAEITDIVREREPGLRAEVRVCVERFADQVVEKLAKVDHEPRAAMGDYVG